MASWVQRKWVIQGDISKLLWTTFALHLNLQYVDNHMINKVKRKPTYWNTMYFPLAGWILIVNHVLIPPLWYFIALWVSSRKVVCKFKVLMRNYLWSRHEHTTRARLSWNNRIIRKENGHHDESHLIKGCHDLVNEQINDPNAKKINLIFGSCSSFAFLNCNLPLMGNGPPLSFAFHSLILI